MSTAEGASAGFHARVADGLSNSLLTDMRKDKASNARRSPGALLTLLAATPIHLATLALIGAGILLIVRGTTTIDTIIGALCVAAALAFRPRFVRNPKSSILRSSPELRALIAEVATCVDSPMPTHLVVDSRFNASAQRTGLRGRTITLGAPLWASLKPSERVALLGHELGHFANGDIAQSRYVHSALVTLSHWERVFGIESGAFGRSTTYFVSRRSTGAGFRWVVQIVFWPVRALLHTYGQLITLLGAATSRRQEHYADLASAAAAGTVAATHMLEALLRRGAAETAASRAYLQRRDAFDEIAAQFATHDIDSAARTAPGAETNRIDASHPPTLHRIALVESYPGIGAAVTRSEPQWAAIDREIEATMRTCAKTYGERIVYRR